MKRVEFRLSQVEYVASNRIPKIPWKIEKKNKKQKSVVRLKKQHLHMHVILHTRCA